MDKTPEQMAAEARARLEAAMRTSDPQTPAGPPRPPAAPQVGPAGQPTSASPWSLSQQGIDLEDASQQARQMGIQEKRAQQSDSGWRTRADKLINIGDDNTAGSVDAIIRPSDVKAAKEYGPMSRQAVSVINKYFADQDVSEMHFNGPDKIFAKYRGERVQVKAEFSSVEEYNRFVEDLIIRADTQHTLEDIKRAGRGVVRMAGGDRMAIMMPPISEFAQLAIHKVVARTWDMNTLVKNGTLTAQMANFLVAAVKAKANILVCGEMGAGKTVMLSLLAQQIGDNERVALIEEVPEIFLDKPDVSRFTYYPDVEDGPKMGLPEILDTVLYMRMDRVIIGEIHDKGMYRMLRVMAAGSDGSLSTFHAGTVDQALAQVRNHVILEHQQMPAAVAAHFIRQAINLVVVVERVRDRHRVVEIAEVEWRNLSDADTLGKNMLFSFDRDFVNDKGEKVGRFITESKPDEKGRILQKAEKHGVHIDDAWFAGVDLGARTGRR